MKSGDKIVYLKYEREKFKNWGKDENSSTMHSSRTTQRNISTTKKATSLKK